MLIETNTLRVKKCFIKMKKLEIPGVKMCSVKLQRMKIERPGSRKLRTPSSRVKKHPGDFVREGITCNEDNCNKSMNYYSSYDRLGFLFDNFEYV